jgi:hypothetical protein
MAAGVASLLRRQALGDILAASKKCARLKYWKRQPTYCFRLTNERALSPSDRNTCALLPLLQASLSVVMAQRGPNIHQKSPCAFVRTKP